VDAARRDIADQMAEAANAWLDLLDDEQRRTAVGAVPADDASDDERRRWFYTPTDHGGLTMHRQRPAQQRRAMRLVATGLSEAGYVTVATCMGRENILDHAEGFRVLLARERGRDPGMYYLRVFGQPGGDRLWGWRFGGHHVSLNNLVVDGELVSTTPCFMGMDPAAVPLLGGAVSRPLARVEDIARALIRSLPDALRSRAVLLDTAPPDLVTANRLRPSDGDRYIPPTGEALWRDVPFPDDEQQADVVALSDGIDEAADFHEADHRAVEYTEQPKGVAGGDLDAGQREQRCALLGTYVDRVPEGARPTWEDAELDAVHLAWAGPLEDGAPTYYRLQGPRLLIEWDNTQRGANHAHSVWRDPTSDFGLNLLTMHRSQHH
jgi:hypothetical protein